MHLVTDRDHDRASDRNPDRFTHVAADRPHERPDKLRAVLVGAGARGRRLAAALPDDVTLVAAVDPDPRLRHPAYGLGVPVVAHLDEAVARFGFDLAIVAVPHRAHFGVTRQLLRAGKHVVKEKPFALDPAEASELGRVAALRGVGLATTLQREHRRSFRLGRGLLPLIGEPTWYHYEHRAADLSTDGWRADADASGGGVLQDLGYHAVDVLRAWFGPPARVSASFAYLTPLTRARGLEDQAALTLGYDGGLAGMLTVSRRGATAVERLEVRGRLGSLVVTPDEVTLLSPAGQVAAHLDLPYDAAEETHRMLTHQVLQLEDPQAVQWHVAEQVETVRIIDAAYASGRRRLTVA